MTTPNDERTNDERRWCLEKAVTICAANPNAQTDDIIDMACNFESNLASGRNPRRDFQAELRCQMDEASHQPGITKAAQAKIIEFLHDRNML